MSKQRADLLLFEKGLVESVEKGKRLIMEGIVFVGRERVDKPGQIFKEDVDIHIKSNPLDYVSRGGLKLEKAINKFQLNMKDKVAMDIGSSTGGFTDCMLKNGAKRVYAVDVGYGQLDWSLRSDPRVKVMERTNIRYVKQEDIGEAIDFISIDVSFISLRLVLPVAKSLLTNNGEIIALVKPQFEAAKEDVGKNGIVRDKNIHIEVLNSIFEFANSIGLSIEDISFSPIRGTKGNIEFLVYLVNKEENNFEKSHIESIVESGYDSLI